VRDGDKQALAYVYFENEPGRRSSAKLLARDEVFLIAVNIAKLPSVPRQILKDIPRPPDSAKRRQISNPIWITHATEFVPSPEHSWATYHFDLPGSSIF
jgi:hypothetical protein